MPYLHGPGPPENEASRSAISPPRAEWKVSSPPKLLHSANSIGPAVDSPFVNGHTAEDATNAETAARLHLALHGLRERWPEYSAAGPPWLWQIVGICVVAAAVAAALVMAWRPALTVLLALLALPFLCVVLLRAVALWYVGAERESRPREDSRDENATPAGDLAPYTVLVPLFREAHVVPDLVAALGAIDYPAERLQIIFIAESIDLETQRALDAAQLAAHMHVVVVPDGKPRTKPRALNFARTHATGDYVVVYDAEDIPEADQLRRALARLRADPALGCVQARLNVYNAGSTWLTRQFAIEYTALFDCLLPALERLRLPLPLGGTSNHFPRRVLEQVGGWDPFNVTEDADLGIRLARHGWRVGVLSSTTWEEAPGSFAVWLGQRKRWLKGWMQTYLVHTREPMRLVRELGLRPFLGLQILMGGLLLSALVHPWFYALAAVEALFGFLTVTADSMAGRVLWSLGVFNLLAGYATGVALGAISVARRKHASLSWFALMMPVYWLLISYAAYRALWQLIVDPYYWEKTEHGARRLPSSTATNTSPDGRISGSSWPAGSS